MNKVYLRKCAEIGVNPQDYPELIPFAARRGITPENTADESDLIDELESLNIKLESLEADVRAKFPLNSGLSPELLSPLWQKTLGKIKSHKTPEYWRFLKTELDVLLLADTPQ